MPTRKLWLGLWEEHIVIPTRMCKNCVIKLGGPEIFHPTECVMSGVIMTLMSAYKDIMAGRSLDFHLRKNLKWEHHRNDSV